GSKMLSGSRPRGNSSTPVNGKIGRMSGSAISFRGPGWSLMARSSPPPRSREHQRRQPAPRAQGQRVGRTHDLEELDELTPRRLFVPVAVALEEGQQLVDRWFALAAAEERRRQLEPRLVIVRVRFEPGAQLADRTHRLLRVLGKFEGRARRGDLGVLFELLRGAGQHLLRLG